MDAEVVVAVGVVGVVVGVEVVGVVGAVGGAGVVEAEAVKTVAGAKQNKCGDQYFSKRRFFFFFFFFLSLNYSVYARTVTSGVFRLCFPPQQKVLYKKY